jgi:hypothetical protein
MLDYVIQSRVHANGCRLLVDLSSQPLRTDAVCWATVNLYCEWVYLLDMMFISEPARLNMVEIWLNIQFDIFFAVKYVLNMVEI